MAKLSLSPTASANTRSLGKLSLNKQTLASLVAHDLESVHGGTIAITAPAAGAIIVTTVLIAITGVFMSDYLLSRADEKVRCLPISPIPQPWPPGTRPPAAGPPPADSKPICGFSQVANCTVGPCASMLNPNICQPLPPPGY